MSGYVEMGYRAVKIKTGALGLEDELTRIHAVRDTIGPDTLFMLDMNAPYGVEDCIAFANAVAPYNILWLEDPLHWHLQPAERCASPTPPLSRLPTANANGRVSPSASLAIPAP